MTGIRRYTHWAFLAILLIFGASAVWAVDLPPAPWYAVAWLQDTDRLHWINSSGEVGSIARPRLINESDERASTNVLISPNGRTLMVSAPVANDRYGIGFYDLASGQWIGAHETQPGEVVASAGDFTPTSSHFVTSLRSEETGDWRVLVFETQTGNALAQLNRTDSFIPDAIFDDPSWYPLITSFGIDEALGTISVLLHQRSVSDAPEIYQGGVPAFRWYPLPPPALANAPVVQVSPGYSPLPGLDVDKFTGQTVVAATNPQFAAPTAYVGSQIVLLQNGQTVPLVTDDAYTLSYPRWLRGGQWIGYRVADGVFAPHLAISTPQGGDGLPLGPNIGEIYATPDGFLAIDTDGFRLLHATDLNFEGFAADFGATLFEPGVPFSVVYTTPFGAVFGLTSVADPLTPGGLDVAQPAESCPGAPPQRLIPGGAGMVSFTNGQPLNLRDAAQGDRVGQLQEGSEFTVENAPPQCAGGLWWWNIVANNRLYWIAEGDVSGYFVEPVAQAAPTMGLVPTNAPPGLAAPATAAPTAIPLPVLECIGSPQSRLALGDTAHTVGSDGTLAMYAAVNDPFPANQLPLQRTVTIIGGPQCRDGIRMWQVNATLNGLPATGWVSEGFGQVYFLQAGPARAQS
jgi:hypothetical protein